MGTGKAVYTTFKVLAVIFSLTATASAGLLALDMTKIVPPTISDTDFKYTIGPPAWLNVSFTATVGYNGSIYKISNVNLTLAIYSNAEGLGTPLFANSTNFTLGPHSTITIPYNFSKINPPLLTHASIRATVKGLITEAGISFMGFGLDMLYTLF